jgi:hypothetical protein
MEESAVAECGKPVIRTQADIKHGAAGSKKLTDLPQMHPR